MEYSKNCPFCQHTRLENNKLVNLPTKNAILFENDNIYVQVDISPLCLGHILIIPNHHYLNIFETPNHIKKEILKLKEKITKLYKEIYNTDILFFEHGSAKSGYAGASIDHAHLHCIPYKFDLKNTLDNELGKAIDCDILDLNSNFKNQFSYIYLENNRLGKKLYKVEKLPSQYLRKLIFKNQGSADYLWQNKCTTPNSQKLFQQTISDLQNKI